MRLKEALNSYELALQVEGKSHKTYQIYMKFLGEFVDFVGWDKDVLSLGPDDIKRFMLQQQGRTARTGDKLTSASIHKYYSVVRTFIRWMWMQEYIPKCITDKTKAPKIDLELPDAMTDDEVERCLTYLNDIGDVRNKVIFEFFLDTGCRLDEVAKLNLEDLNIRDGYAKVLGKGRKEGMVPIGRSLAKDLQVYLTRYRKPADPSETAVFLNRDGERLKRNGLQMLIRRVLAKGRVSGKAGPHKLRHTFATNYLKNGGNLEALRRILRHSDIKTTQRYINFLPQDVLDQHREVSPLDKFHQ